MTAGEQKRLEQILEPASGIAKRLGASGPELTWPGKRALGDTDLLRPATHWGPYTLARTAGNRGVADRNFVVRGDNRQAMAALLSGGEAFESLAGQVKLCYLDPPFNTGAKFSTYSDSKASADWLDDLRERLILIRALLSIDGSVWLHLDDSEQHHARVIMDEVFGREAFVSTIIWQKRMSRDNRTAFSSAHDYIHVYAPRGAKSWKKIRNGLPDTGTFANPDNDPRGPWRSGPMSAQAGHGTKAQFYTVTTPTGATHEPPPGRCWTYSEPRLRDLDRDGRVYWPRNGAGRPRLKKYATAGGDLAPSTIWLAEVVGDTAEAKRELLREFPGESAFDTPKPERLMERIIQIATNEGDLVLDTYLGSGTTAAVAIKLSRNYVGIESSANVIDNVVVPRLRRRGVFADHDVTVFEVKPSI